jgi:hypothetical protein
MPSDHDGGILQERIAAVAPDAEKRCAPRAKQQ